VSYILPVGGVGVFREDVQFLTTTPTTTRENALLMARVFLVPEDLGTPPGAVTLRGAWNFRTPKAWDSVYTSVFNAIERPVAPMMSIRVETDWYVHESEFRYVLQQGEGMSVSRTLPIGQVFFVPRETVTTRMCTEEESATFRALQETFSREKSETKLTTAYGLEYSPHYFRRSRAETAASAADPAEGGDAVAHASSASAGGELPRMPLLERTGASAGASGRAREGAAAVQSPRIAKVGRNEPCPCGSGKKYKWCHGEG
jgi:hypothetical protein